MDFGWILLPLAALLAEHGEGGGLSPVGTPFWVPLVIILIVLLLLWWGLTRNTIVEASTGHVDAAHGHDEHASHTDHAGPGAGHDHDAEHATAVSADTLAAEPDDLQKIEGIGPKISSVLNAAGIVTFAQLAETSVAQLNQIVREDAGITIAFPDTWPEQAALAAAGKWAELAALQDELKGGRK